jgi:hypothetical protein
MRYDYEMLFLIDLNCKIMKKLYNPTQREKALLKEIRKNIKQLRKKEREQK